MKALVQKISFGFLTGILLAAPGVLNAQVDYYEDFSNDTQHWSDLDFRATDVAVCDDGFALRANPVNQYGEITPVETVSQSLGVSNGEQIMLSYNYKLLYYDNVLPHVPVDDADWGVILVESGPTQNGPWTTIDAILPEDHYITSECTTRKAAFTPPADEEVYLRITAGGGNTPDINYFVYIDNISLLQDVMTVSTVAGDTDFKAWPNPVTDYLNLDYSGAINEVVIYNMQGQEVIVENIDRNLSRLDMSGLSEGNYVFKVITDNNLRTFTIVKD